MDSPEEKYKGIKIGIVGFVGFGKTALIAAIEREAYQYHANAQISLVPTKEEKKEQLERLVLPTFPIELLPMPEKNETRRERRKGNKNKKRF